MFGVVVGGVAAAVAVIAGFGDVLPHWFQFPAIRLRLFPAPAEPKCNAIVVVVERTAAADGCRCRCGAGGYRRGSRSRQIVVGLRSTLQSAPDSAPHRSQQDWCVGAGCW